MNVLSRLPDGRIQSDNYLVELSITEYLALIKGVLEQNEFQRRRVSSSKSIYSLLKQDIQRGCVIPPIVLALTSVPAASGISISNLATYVAQHSQNLVILDGLQRTYSLLDLSNELHAHGDPDAISKLSEHQLRVEIYVGINRLGILYRMLTLNTGQTPMSLRQQIEMLYLDYAKVPLQDNIRLIREVDTRTASGPTEYNFREIIEGFNSYLERNELPIERADLLENIKILEKLSQENAQRDIFKDYIEAWNAFIQKITAVTNGVSLPEPDASAPPLPMGKTAAQCFKKAQAITGFGAAIGRLVDFTLIPDFTAVKEAAEDLTPPPDPVAFLEELNKTGAWINANAKRIGNAPRMFYQYYFRELFNPESSQYKNPALAVSAAFQKYLSQNT
jgi:hypothetical protein